MTLSVTHPFVSPVSDEGDPSLVGPNEWNATHALSGTIDAAQFPALTGDVTTSAGAVATTLATVNGNVGTFGSTTKASVVTVNAKGLVTAASESTVTPAASSVTGAGDLTKVDDTNVTLTLGGTPTGALLKATSVTVGWSGTLAASRGGTGLSSLGTGVATWLGTPSSANLAAAVTDETGTGALVFGTSPGFTTAANPVSSDGAALGTTALPWSDLFLASGGVLNWANGDAIITHSSDLLAFTGAASGYTFDARVSASLGSGASNEALRVVNNTDNSNVVVASFEGDRSTFADFDTARIQMKLSDDAGSQTSIAELLWQATDVNVGTSVDGIFAIRTIAGGTMADRVVVNNASIKPSTDDGLALGVSGTAFSDLFLASGGVINWNAGDVTVTHSSNVLAFAGAASGYTFDSAIVLGHTALVAGADAQGNALTPNHQIHATSAAGSSQFIARWAASTVAPRITFGKSRGASIGSFTVVNSDDIVGELNWVATDGTDFAPAAQIRAEVDGTPGNNDMPGRIVFATTADGANAITSRLILDSVGTLKPNANDGVALGTTALGFSDLFLATGAVINFNNGDVLLTHSANTLAHTGASSGYTFDAAVLPSANDAAALGASGTAWADCFLASGGVINWNAGDVTVTHSSDLLAFAGAASGYTFDSAIVVTGTSANIIAAGPAGSTNPTITVDASTASAATGVKVKSAAAAGGVAVQVTSSGSNESMTIDAKGTGGIALNKTATGGVAIGNIAITYPFQVKGADGLLFLLSGDTKGFRITVNSTGSIFEGVDNTGSASYQPIYIGGSTVNLQISGADAITIAATTKDVAAKSTTDSTSSTTGALTVAGGLGVAKALFGGTSIKSVSATDGVGYATGAGGTVTQATSKSTGATLSKVCGAVTMNNAALAAATIVSFVLTNTAIAATDVLVLNHISGGTVGSYTLNAQCAAGSATINVRNNTAGSLSDAIVIQFVVIKGVNS